MFVVRILSAAAVFVTLILPVQAERFSNLDYTVLRNGDVIGSHTINIKGDANDTSVTIATDIKVKFAFITAYKFLHSAKETWTNGQLVSLTSETDDDGTTKRLAATASGSGLSAKGNVQGSNIDTQAPAGVIPASLWNSAILTQSQVLNTLDGHLMDIAIEDLGQEPVTVQGQERMTRHFRLNGELTRDLWFDSSNNLLRVQFKGEDGSDIVYALD